METLALHKLELTGTGVWYGYTRQNSLEKFIVTRKKEEEAQLYEAIREESLVAFEAYKNRLEAEAGEKDGVTTDSDSYKFNAERWMNWAIARSDSENKK
ncbi:hypothetical protein HK099_006490 [Clydaea vesicula]|uniref:Uncharacterized protein n=1 Tax=Clydaea vesicula TaxID=447962 RepID=A0AAD5TXS1_9FUNG|nr:hypothetical protein HK099_006490 [Clydaea vesicula]